MRPQGNILVAPSALQTRKYLIYSKLGKANARQDQAEMIAVVAAIEKLSLGSVQTEGEFPESPSRPHSRTGRADIEINTRVQSFSESSSSICPRSEIRRLVVQATQRLFRKPEAETQNSCWGLEADEASFADTHRTSKLL